jgi:hypothetical protein
MLLWNWLMPGLFGLAKIPYWQGWGLLLLSQLLFRGNRFKSDRPYASVSKKDGRQKTDGEAGAASAG